jgi:carboxyl-terminal processing protease
LSSLNSKGLVSEFAYNYLDANRKIFNKYQSFDEFNKLFQINASVMNEFIAYGEKNGVKRDEAGLKVSSGIIRTQLKALIARQMYKNEGYYAIIHSIDKTLQKALEMVEKKEVASRVIENKSGN